MKKIENLIIDAMTGVSALVIAWGIISLVQVCVQNTCAEPSYWSWNLFLLLSGGGD
jgi:hypothetical protein